MSERALEFVELWVSEKVEPGDDSSQAEALAAQCRAAASEEGIPQSELDEAFDDLTAFIAGEIAEVNDRDDGEGDDDDEEEDNDDEDDEEEDGDHDDVHEHDEDKPR